MTPKPTPLQKAAILLTSLDDLTAAALLRTMTPAERERVERELRALGEVDPQIQQEVVAEFRRFGGSPADSDSSGIELDSSLAQKLSRSASGFAVPSSATAEAPAFGFLDQAEAGTLVQLLRRERPQVIALVVSHLDPDRAAKVLDRFDTNMQGDVLHCLSHLDETDPAVLSDLEEHLHAQIREHVRLRKCQAAGAATVGAILAAIDLKNRSTLVRHLAERDRGLAERLHLPGDEANAWGTDESNETTSTGNGVFIDTPSFERLYHLTNDDLKVVIGRAKSEVVVMALAGADAPLVERVLKCVPPKQARLLTRALKHLGPTRLSDVEEAQLVLATLAHQVEDRRKAKRPTRRRALATQ